MSVNFLVTRIRTFWQTITVLSEWVRHPYSRKGCLKRHVFGQFESCDILKHLKSKRHRQDRKTFTHTFEKEFLLCEEWHKDKCHVLFWSSNLWLEFAIRLQWKSFVLCKKNPRTCTAYAQETNSEDKYTYLEKYKVMWVSRCRFWGALICSHQRF